MSDSNQLFDDVILELQKIFKHKNALYGNSAFYTGDVPSFKYWMRLSDIRRKTTRLDQLTDMAIQGVPKARKKLIADYKDLAIYAIIAVAVLEEK